MGTSVDMIEQHYGHLLAPHATKSRQILDQIRNASGRKLDVSGESANEAAPATPGDARLNEALNDESPLTDSNR